MNLSAMNPEARYVLPSFEERTPYGMKQQDPYAKLFSERVVFLGTQVDDTSANDIMVQLLTLEVMDNNADITMYINSPGGSMTALAAIIDTMQHIKPHVATVCLGQAASAAAVILAAGQKGKRAVLPNSRVMIHQPSTQGERGQASDIEIQAAEMLRMRTWLEDTLADFTGKTSEDINRDLERDKFLTAPQAIEYGIADVILPPRKNK
jgi:ATP-dependent Clp protease protease subunit